MKKVDHEILANFPLEGLLTKVSDLLYYEGPLLSHFSDESGHDYLYYWCDADSVANRWIVMEVAKKDIEKFESGEMPASKLLSRYLGGFIYYVDIDDQLGIVTTRKVPAGSIDKEYLPA